MRWNNRQVFFSFIRRAYARRHDHFFAWLFLERTSSLAVTLTNIYYDIVRYGLSTVFALGMVGSSLNIALFSRRQLRNTSCCTCILKTIFLCRRMCFLLMNHLDFLAAFCSNLLSLSWGILPTLYGLNHVYPGSSSAIFCKLLIYLPHIDLQMTRIFLLWVHPVSLSVTLVKYQSLFELCQSWLSAVLWSLSTCPYISMYKDIHVDSTMPLHHFIMRSIASPWYRWLFRFLCLSYRS